MFGFRRWTNRPCGPKPPPCPLYWKFLSYCSWKCGNISSLQDRVKYSHERNTNCEEIWRKFGWDLTRFYCIPSSSMSPTLADFLILTSVFSSSLLFLFLSGLFVPPLYLLLSFSVAFCLFIYSITYFLFLSRSFFPFSIFLPHKFLSVALYFLSNFLPFSQAHFLILMSDFSSSLLFLFLTGCSLPL